MKPEFPRTVTLYGAGLMGGSFALALKKHFPGIHVVGFDKPQILKRARSLGIVDDGDHGKSDLVILATPVAQILDLLVTLGPDQLILDVGSTKVDICRIAEERNLPFVGGHPMTGTERSGPDAASADLFQAAPFFLCSVRSTPDGAVDKISRVVQAIGANPVLVSAEDHDRIVAQISHLPQLLSSLLADHAADNLHFAGPGVKSMTRLAASPFDMWRDIFKTSGTLPEEARKFADRLRALADALEAGDMETVREVFERANKEGK